MSYALAVLVLLLATVLRLWELPTLPSGLQPAEINSLRLADTIRSGVVSVLYDIGRNTTPQGQEGLYPAGLAVLTSVLGSGSIMYRILSVWAGLITLALTYSLGIRLFGRVAGIAAMTLMGVMMWPALLSRLIIVEAFVPMLVVGTTLALARALAVYRRIQVASTHTSVFAVLGILLGLGFYIHPVSILTALAALIFIGYILTTQHQLLQHRLGYIGFALLMMIILGLPYLVSTFNRPELAATSRLFGEVDNVFSAISAGLGAFIFTGDQNPVYNLAGRPLIDLLSGFFVLIGLLAMLRDWRQPRSALVLIMLAMLLPGAFFSNQTPSFLAYAALLAPLVLCFGHGVNLMWNSLQAQRRPIFLLVLLGLFGFNVFWTARDLFQLWPQQPQMQLAYRSNLGNLAHYIDQTSRSIPTVLCYSSWANQGLSRDLSAEQIILITMNSAPNELRFTDCSQAIVFTNGGAEQQWIMSDPSLMERMPDALRVWAERGERSSLGPGQPESIIRLNLTDELADALGVYTTTTPALYGNVARITDAVAVPPPVRLGGNITWMGYEPDPDGSYQPGDTVEVVTTWRVEGLVPRDLTLFTHIISDPVTIAAQRDILAANPRQLRPRDVIMQVTNVPLPESILVGEYRVSVGAYQSSSNLRLPVFDANNQPQGDNLFLYPITVAASESTD